MIAASYPSLAWQQLKIDEGTTERRQRLVVELAVGRRTPASAYRRSGSRSLPAAQHRHGDLQVSALLARMNAMVSNQPALKRRTVSGFAVISLFAA